MLLVFDTSYLAAERLRSYRQDVSRVPSQSLAGSALRRVARDLRAMQLATTAAELSGNITFRRQR
jgi:hypothetical protein